MVELLSKNVKLYQNCYNENCNDVDQFQNDELLLLNTKIK